MSKKLAPPAAPEPDDNWSLAKALEMFEDEGHLLPGLTVMFTTITPEKAARLLSNSTYARRRLSIKQMAVLQDALLQNEWMVNGDAVVLDTAGMPMEGNHRLEACVRTGCAFRTLLVGGVDPKAIGSYDTYSRTMIHTIPIRKRPSPRTLAPTLIRLWQWEHGHMYSPGRSGAKTPSQQEALLGLDKYPSVDDSVRVADRVRDHIPPGQFAWFHMLVKSRYEKKVRDFVNGIITGSNLPADSSVLHLRNYLMMKKMEGEEIWPPHRLALLIKSWNLFVQNKHVGMDAIMYKDADRSTSTYPKLIV